MSEFDELKKLAEAAAPGKWEYSMTSSGFRKIKASDKLICGVSSFGCQDARYIAAANPATILSLIARLESAEADAKQADDFSRQLADKIEPLEKELIEARAELAQEMKRLDWALEHGASLGMFVGERQLLNYFGPIEPEQTLIDNPRQAIDELRGKGL